MSDDHDLRTRDANEAAAQKLRKKGGGGPAILDIVMLVLVIGAIVYWIATRPKGQPGEVAPRCPKVSAWVGVLESVTEPAHVARLASACGLKAQTKSGVFAAPKDAKGAVRSLSVRFDGERVKTATATFAKTEDTRTTLKAGLDQGFESSGKPGRWRGPAKGSTWRLDSADDTVRLTLDR